MVDRRFFKEALGWGFALWLFGYVLGIVFFFLVPASLIGWAITPFGIAATLWVLLKKVGEGSLGYYVSLGTAWAIVAIACDYLFLVQLLQPAGGYYKADVYLYYALTFLLPLAVWWWKRRGEPRAGEVSPQ